MIASTAQKIKNIELHTKRLLKNNLFGSSRAALKGTGLEFDQIRDYQLGDDVRVIDWNSCARINKLMVKQFHEEQHRTIIIALDISPSQFYGSCNSLKYEKCAEVAAILAYAGYLAKDEVGLILFSDTTHLYIPPRRGKLHNNVILEKIMNTNPKKGITNIQSLFHYCTQLRKKNAFLFLISDFIAENFQEQFVSIARQYEVILIRINDELEKVWKYPALITVQDIENGKEAIINTKKHAAFLQEWSKQLYQNAAKSNIDLLAIEEQQPIIDQIINFFSHRNRYL